MVAIVAVAATAAIFVAGTHYNPKLRTPLPVSPSGPGLSSSSRTITVHVTGAVHKPGVITLGPEDNLIELIKRAGGTTPEADLDSVDWRAPLQDGARIVINARTVESVASPPIPATAGPTVMGPTTVGPTVVGPTKVGPTVVGPTVVGRTQLAPTTRNPAPKPTAIAQPEATPPEIVTAPRIWLDWGSVAPLDLNTASNFQIQMLPTIGPHLAGAITAERDKNGGFKDLEDLRRVPGIDESHLIQLRKRLTTEP